LLNTLHSSQVAPLTKAADRVSSQDISTAATSKNATCPGKAWHRTFTCIASYCWVKLVAKEWIVLAVCTLGAYLDSANMACLALYFCKDGMSLTIYQSHCWGWSQVMHMTGCDRPVTYSPKDWLRALGSIVSSRHPATPAAPREPRSLTGANSMPIG